MQIVQCISLQIACLQVDKITPAEKAQSHLAGQDMADGFHLLHHQHHAAQEMRRAWILVGCFELHRRSL